MDDMTVKREGSVITFDYYGVDIIFGDMWTAKGGKCFGG